LLPGAYLRGHIPVTNCSRTSPWIRPLSCSPNMESTCLKGEQQIQNSSYINLSRLATKADGNFHWRCFVHRIPLESLASRKLFELRNYHPHPLALTNFASQWGVISLTWNGFSFRKRNKLQSDWPIRPYQIERSWCMRILRKRNFISWRGWRNVILGPVFGHSGRISTSLHTTVPVSKILAKCTQ
jgi:hypothetical protein